MTSGPDAFERFEQLARRLMTEHDTDIILYSGPIDTTPASRLVLAGKERANRRKNVWLIIITTGGLADAAYRIAVYLKQNYDKFTIYVSDYCKSAGTLVAVGADEIVVPPRSGAVEAAA